MKKSPLRVALLISLLPMSVLAQSAFEGTWKVDLSKMQLPKKPDVLFLKDGVYQCKTCVPPISIEADGADHPVSGHPYFDTMAILVVDGQSIKETDKKSGRVVATSFFKVATDGKTAQFTFTDSSDTDAAPVTGKGTMTRVAAGPAASHAISGSWLTSSIQDVSDNGLTLTFKLDGDQLSMSNQTGQSYTAKLDGTDAPYRGDPGITSVSIKKTGARTLTEIDKRHGNVISVAELTVSEDGKTLHVMLHDKLHGTNSSVTAVKQSP